MSRRHHLDQARTALAVRRVQQDAAMMALQVQRRAEAKARERLTETEAVRLDAEAAWVASLSAASFDPTADRFWRASVLAAAIEETQAKTGLDSEIEAALERRSEWEAQLRRTDAAEALERTAARRAAAAVDARRLEEAEDAARGRRTDP